MSSRILDGAIRLIVIGHQGKPLPSLEKSVASIQIVAADDERHCLALHNEKPAHAVIVNAKAFTDYHLSGICYRLAPRVTVFVDGVQNPQTIQQSLQAGALDCFSDITRSLDQSRLLSRLEALIRQTDLHHDQLQTLFSDSARLAVIEIDADYRVLRWGKTAAKTFGWTETEIAGHSLFDDTLFIEELDSNAIREQLKDLFIGKVSDTSFTTQVNNKYDSTLWCEWYCYAQHDDSATVTSLLLIANNITLNRETQSALSDSEARYRKLVQLMPDAVFIHQNGQIVFTNEAGVRLLGKENVWEIIGGRFLDFVKTEDLTPLAEALREQDRSADQPLNIAMRLRQPDGRTLIVESSTIPYTFQGTPAMLTVIRDITRRHNRQQRQQLQSKTLLDIAHSQFDTSTTLADKVVPALQQACNTLCVNLTSLWLFNENRTGLEPVAVFDADGGTPPDPDFISLSAYHILYKQLMESRVATYSATVSPDIDCILPADNHFAGESVKAGLVTAVNSAERTIGLLFFEDMQHDHNWLDDEVTFAASVADLMATLLETHARQEAQTAELRQRGRVRALSKTAEVISQSLNLDTVLNLVFEQIISILPPVDFLAFTLVDDEGVAKIVRHQANDAVVDMDKLPLSYPTEDLQNYKVVTLTKHPLYIRDTQTSDGWEELPGWEWARSIYIVPITYSENRLSGIIEIGSGEPDGLDNIDVNYLRAFADQIATAIENARLFSETRQYNALLEERINERTAELTRERAQLRNILNEMAEGVVYIETDGIIYVNAALEEMVKLAPGADYETLVLKNIGTAILKHYAPPDLQSLFRALESQHIWRGEVRLPRTLSDKTTTKNTFAAGITCSLVDDNDGNTIGIVALIRDISEQKALEERQKRFVANASHELRNPIASLVMRLEILRRTPERLDEHVQVLENAANHLRLLSEDLLDSTRLDADRVTLNREHIDLAEVVQQVVSLQTPEASSKNLQLIYTRPPQPLIVDADRTRIMQVVINLIVNAINYTPEGGMIWVRVAPEVNSMVAGGDYVTLSVKDTGIGIKPETLNSIFAPFFRAVSEEKKGTGLGLSIVKDIILRHGGEVNVTSEYGFGSTFTVRLVLVQP